MAAQKELVPKGPSAQEFDRDAALARLYALPLPPTRHRCKPFNTSTPLGRIMAIKGVMVRDVEGIPGCPNARVMSDYLAGRKPIAPHHRGALARGLGVDVRLL